MLAGRPQLALTQQILPAQEITGYLHLPPEQWMRISWRWNAAISHFPRMAVSAIFGILAGTAYQASPELRQQWWIFK
jgi:hypothetical protein